MIEMTLREIAEIVGGTLHDVGDPAVTVTGAVEFDSRRINSGDLFLALPGEHVDGHDYAGKAVASGAVAVLAARPVGVPAIVVEPFAPAAGASANRSYVLAHDTDGSGAAVLAAQAKLARASVDRLAAAGLNVVGVTGSAGKTSTKDLLARVLAPLGAVVAPPGSFNNELGHPWTALRAGADSRFLVLELSARGPGHIKALTEIAPPRIGVVLNVGTAHLGEFGGRDAIAQAKGELVEALPPTGVAVLNADDPRVAAMAERTRARVVTFGQASGADVRATDIVLDAEARARFTLHANGSHTEVHLAVYGEHQISNALAAAAVALECGADLDTVARALAGATVDSAHRMDVRTRADGVTVVDDSYNANPDSMRAALKALVSMSRTGGTPDAPRGRRSWAVLGEMAELGEESVVEHDNIGRLAVRLDVDRLIVVGTGRPARALHQGAVMEGSWGEESILVPDIESAIALLDNEIAAGDVVLVKASNSAGLWAVAQHVLASGGQGTEAAG
ncbi:UDP-N-acetylmuramoyl-tripeptide--D-alanyl-D-alanine ligase [Nocardia sp. NRRL WC-3656]|uniref:UDP-N-acetylmuramoyl-tripeptide--D-alanyl-D- alanine ligase n=1 Tax=Nocardia sp. NRRL WC-3656 TaxID=1463824 RepID=UPI0004C32757|nr:UDP-N-acetylmuramoyl-tripeptide--D-alanyl-D-alanine ligase [Nocardia sp. NRRL WC-3656]